MKFIDWDDEQAVGTSKTGKWKKWQDGKNRVRFLTPMISYERKWPQGIKEEFVAAVLDLDDNSTVKYVNVKSSTRKALKSFKEENGDPAGPDAPAFCITRSGSGLDTEYTCIASSKAVPIPGGIDIAAIKADLLDFVKKTSIKAAGSGAQEVL